MHDAVRLDMDLSFTACSDDNGKYIILILSSLTPFSFYVYITNSKLTGKEQETHKVQEGQ